MLLIIQYIYTSVYALVGFISQNESAVHVHESFKIQGQFSMCFWEIWHGINHVYAKCHIL